MKLLFESLFGPLFPPEPMRTQTSWLSSDRTIAALDALALWDRQHGRRREDHQLREPSRLRWRARRRWREEGHWLELEDERVRAVLLSDDWDTPGRIAEARTRPEKLPPAKVRTR